jgi:hypothetical protein
LAWAQGQGNACGGLEMPKNDSCRLTKRRENHKL